MNTLLEKIRFIAEIDIPLAVVTTILFLLSNHSWARKKDVDTEVNLRERLPLAQAKVIALFCCIVAFAWFANIGLWAGFLFLLIVGVIISFAAGLGEGEGAILIASVAFLVRDWAFGFPLVRLHAAEDLNDLNQVLDAMVGGKGKTVSHLRPYGDVEIDGKIHQAVSENGLMLEAESQVVVVGKRAGVLSVKLAEVS